MRFSIDRAWSERSWQPRSLAWSAGLLAAIVALAPTLAGAEQPTELGDRIARLEAENAALRARVAELEGQLRRSDARNAELDQRVKKAEEAAASVPADLVPYSQLLSRVYTPAGDRTTVSVAPNKMTNVAGSRSDAWLELGYSHPGKERSEAVKSLSGRISVFQNGPENRATRRIVFTAGAVELSAEVKGYDSKRRRVAIPGRPEVRRDDEFLSFELTAQELATLAGADEVTVRFGPTTARLTREQITSLRGLARSLER